jgi:hypothetical protein
MNWPAEVSDWDGFHASPYAGHVYYPSPPPAEFADLGFTQNYIIPTDYYIVGGYLSLGNLDVYKCPSLQRVQCLHAEQRISGGTVIRKQNVRPRRTRWGTATGIVGHLLYQDLYQILYQNGRGEPGARG